MDSIKSFKGYGKVDELEQQAFKKKTRKRIVTVIISSIVLLLVVVAAVVGIVVHKRNSSSDSANSIPSTELTPSASLKTVCEVTQYPKSCFASISSVPSSNTTDPQLLFKLSLKVAMDELSKITDYPSKLAAKTNDVHIKSAISVCQTVLDDALDRLNESISSMEVTQGENGKLSLSKIKDMETWLSTTLTDQETCLEAFKELNSSSTSDFVYGLKTAMENSTEFASNSLAIVTKVLGLFTEFNIPIHRKLLGFGGTDSKFPEWVGPVERRLLLENTTSSKDVHVTVAKDGSGNYRTIKEAVALVPKKSDTRYVIYVKEGKYEENVVLDKNKWNVMLVGDSMDKTIISGSLNFVDGTPTFATATFAVAGKGFIAKDIAFENTAGAAKHQAVAFRSGSDRSVYYRCKFNAYQDTLYAHSNRQFYRECDITGTIDFIFGNAAVVFQKCNIMPRQPLPNQFNTITAQGKKDPNQNTGISIQNCKLAPLDHFIAPTYLGRPWQPYSTTVIMQSDMGSFLHPLGWVAWVRDVDPPTTIFYAEYQNTGPGSSVTGRVKWAGYRSTLSDTEAAKFTVDSLIQGGDWLAASQVTYDNAL